MANDEVVLRYGETIGALEQKRGALPTSPGEESTGYS